METLKSSDSPRVIAEKIDKNLSLSKKGYKYHFDVKPPANPDEKTLWIDLFVKTIIKEINTKTYADEYFAAHPSINRSTFKYIGDDGKPTLEFKKMIYGDDYDPDAKYILQPKNSTIAGFCKPIETQTGIQPYNLKEVVFNTKNVIDMYDTFKDAKHLEYIDTSKWNTSNVIELGSAFYECSALKELDVSKWDTGNVTNMFSVFNTCRALTSLDVSRWNTSKVTDMTFMFTGCGNLRTLDVSNWNTGNVTTMRSMFDRCESLTPINVSNWNTSNVTDMSSMFNGCSALTSLDISNWNTSKVTNMSNMFYGDNKLTTITGILDLRACTNYKDMFSGCSALTMVKVKNLPTDIDTFCSTARIDKSKVIVVA